MTPAQNCEFETSAPSGQSTKKQKEYFRVSNRDRPLSFKEVLTGSKESLVKETAVAQRALRNPSMARYEGGNLILELDEDEYEKVLKNYNSVWSEDCFFQKGREHL